MSKSIYLLFFLLLFILNIQSKKISVNQIIKCNKTSDCLSLHYCNNKKICIHKNLFPMTTREIIGITYILKLIGTVVIGIAVGIANAGGMGGGSVMVPLVNILFYFKVMGFFNYSLKISIMLSYLLVFGGSIGNFIRSSTIRHDITGGPACNYDLILISLPTLSIGAVFGVIANKFSPDIIIILVEVIVLLQALSRAWGRYSKIRKEELEQEKLKKYHELQEDPNKEVENLENENPQKDEPPGENEYRERIENIDNIEDAETKKLYSHDLKLFSWIKWSKILLVEIFFVFMSFVKGSKLFPSIAKIPYCGWTYWIVNFGLIILAIILSYFIVMSIMRKNDILIAIDENIIKKIVFFEFDKKNITRLLFASFEAGFFGGMLGLGGGVILTPIWLTMKFVPQEVTVTSILAVIFNSFMSAFIVVFGGYISINEMLFFTILSFVSSFVVATLFRKLVEKTKKQSLLITIILVKILIGLIALPILGINRIIETDAKLFRFGSFC